MLAPLMNPALQRSLQRRRCPVSRGIDSTRELQVKLSARYRVIGADTYGVTKNENASKPVGGGRRRRFLTWVAVPGDLTITRIHTGYMLGRVSEQSGPGPWWRTS